MATGTSNKGSVVGHTEKPIPPTKQAEPGRTPPRTVLWGPLCLLALMRSPSTPAARVGTSILPSWIFGGEWIPGQAQTLICWSLQPLTISTRTMGQSPARTHVLASMPGPPSASLQPLQGLSREGRTTPKPGGLLGSDFTGHRVLDIYFQERPFMKSVCVCACVRACVCV